MGTTDIKEACDLMNALVVELAYFNPLPGYFYSFSHFEAYLAPLVEFTHSGAIVALKQKGYVVWSYFVSTTWQSLTSKDAVMMGSSWTRQ